MQRRAKSSRDSAARPPPHWVSGPATRCPSEARLSPPPSHRGPQMRKPLAVPSQRPRSIDVRPWPIWTAPTRSKGPPGSVAVLSSSPLSLLPLATRKPIPCTRETAFGVLGTAGQGPTHTHIPQPHSKTKGPHSRRATLRSGFHSRGSDFSFVLRNLRLVNVSLRTFR